jgi:ubiquinone/menaquinone biosynthesis C-methylase UbiE
MDNEAYIERRLKESGGFFGSSFSNRYMNEKRYLSIRKSFFNYLNERGSAGIVKILEVATGDGWLIFRLGGEAAARKDLDFSGIDLSPLDIGFACRRKEYFKLSNYDFKVMDAQKLDFKQGEFDLIICSEMIEHIIEPSIALKEIYRVLKKGGVLIMTTPNKKSSIPTRTFRFVRRLFKSSRPEQGFSGDYLIGGVGHDHVSVHTKAEWVRMIKDEGFIVRLVRGTSGMFFGSRDLDKHRIFFAISVVLDVIFEKLPFSYLWSESFIFVLEK